MMRRNSLSVMLRGMMMGAVMSIAAPAAMAVQMDALVVYPPSRGEIVFFLADHPVFNYTGSTLTVETGAMKAQLALPEVGTMKFEKRETSSVKAAQEQVAIDMSRPECVRVSGLVPGCELTASTLDGRVLGRYTADADGVAEISLATLTPGSVAVVADRNQTLTVKLIKK